MEREFGDGRTPAFCRPSSGGRADERLCREFGISRKTGYKIFDRYKDQGLEALTIARAGRCVMPTSCRSRSSADRRTQAGEAALGRTQDPGTAGRRLAGDVRMPAKSTVHAVLDRHGLVKRDRQRAQPRQRHAVVGRRRLPTICGAPTYKGEFKLGNGRYCYPLTVTDHASRYLLLCEALGINPRRPRFHAPLSDCSTSAACPSPSGPTTACRSPAPMPSSISASLSVWWLRLGIAIERIKPGHPQQNGRHERMHLTLKKEATRPPGMNSLQQQAKFDAFVHEFNAERPHEALAMECPAELYTASPRPYDGLPELELSLARPRYPGHRLRPNLHAPQKDQYLDRARRPEPRHQGSRRRHLARQLHALRSRIHRPGAKNLADPSTTRSARGCHPCLRYDLLPMSPGRTECHWRARRDSNP